MTWEEMSYLQCTCLNAPCACEHITPEGWVNPVQTLEARHQKLQIQHEKSQKKVERMSNYGPQHRPAQFDIGSNWLLDPIQSKRIPSNRTQSNRTQSDPIQSSPMVSNPMDSHSMGSNPMELNQISFNGSGFIAMPSNQSNPIREIPIQCHPVDCAGRLNDNPASISPLDRLNANGTQSTPASILLIRELPG